MKKVVLFLGLVCMASGLYGVYRGEVSVEKISDHLQMLCTEPALEADLNALETERIRVGSDEFFWWDKQAKEKFGDGIYYQSTREYDFLGYINAVTKKRMSRKCKLYFVEK